MSGASDKALDGVWITLWSVLAGAGVATACFCFPLSQAGAVLAGGFVILLVSMGPCTAIGGAAIGLVAAAYLVPLLLGTRLERSLPVVLGSSVPVAVVATELLADPLWGIAAGCAAQAAVAAVIRGREWFRPAARGRSLCVNCGFDCRGVTSEWCPECGFGGPEWAARNPLLCGVCGKKRANDGPCEACGAQDFNGADWRNVLKRSRK